MTEVRSERGYDAADAAPVRRRADHRRRDQWSRHLPRLGHARRRRGPCRTRRLRERRIGCVIAHDPRWHPISRERRVPPRSRVGDRTQRAPAHRTALCAAAPDDHPDLLHLLRDHRRTPAIPPPRMRSSHTERGAALIKIGLVIYDSFSRSGGRVPRHEFHGRRRSVAQLPALNPEVKYTATYWDASLHDPERLALDVLRDGRAAGGDRARAANYTAAVGVDRGRVVLRDGETGAETAFAASVVINASGPWTDLTNLSLGDPTAHMGGTKGSHIVLDHPELLAATGGRELFFENKDGRIVLIYPLKGRVLVGTTDLEHNMADPIVCTEAEVDYFIDLVRQVLPGHRGEPLAHRLSLLGRATAARPRQHRPRLRVAGVPYRRRAADRRRRHGAEPRRRQMDHLPGLRRASRRSGAGTARPTPKGLDQGRGDRRRTRLPDHRACRASSGSPSTRGPAPGPRRDAARPLRDCGGRGHRGCHRR